MSKSGLLSIPKDFRTIVVRWCGIVAAFGALAGYTWALWSVELLLLNVKYVLSMIVAIALAIALVCASVWMSAKLTGQVAHYKSEWKNYSLRAGLTLIVWVLTLVFVDSVIEWSYVGSGVRENSLLSFLPEGNLLVAGGRAGLTYALLITIIAVFMLWGKIPEWSKRLVTTNAASSFTPRSRPKHPKEMFSTGQLRPLVVGDDASTPTHELFETAGFANRE